MLTFHDHKNPYSVDRDTKPQFTQTKNTGLSFKESNKKYWYCGHLIWHGGRGGMTRINKTNKKKHKKFISTC